MATSWVIRNKATKHVVCETWDPARIRGLTEAYEAVPIADYLAEVNRAALGRQQRGESVDAALAKATGEGG